MPTAATKPTTIAEYKRALCKRNVPLPSGQASLATYQQLYQEAFEEVTDQNTEPNLPSSRRQHAPATSALQSLTAATSSPRKRRNSSPKSPIAAVASPDEVHHDGNSEAADEPSVAKQQSERSSCSHILVALAVLTATVALGITASYGMHADCTLVQVEPSVGPEATKAELKAIKDAAAVTPVDDFLEDPSDPPIVDDSTMRDDSDGHLPAVADDESDAPEQAAYAEAGLDAHWLHAKAQLGGADGAHGADAEVLDSTRVVATDGVQYEAKEGVHHGAQEDVLVEATSEEHHVARQQEAAEDEALGEAHHYHHSIHGTDSALSEVKEPSVLDHSSVAASFGSNELTSASCVYYTEDPAGVDGQCGDGMTNIESNRSSGDASSAFNVASAVLEHARMVVAGGLLLLADFLTAVISSEELRAWVQWSAQTLSDLFRLLFRSHHLTPCPRRSPRAHTDTWRVVHPLSPC